MFIEDCELYKTMKKVSDRAKKQTEIVDKYLTINSPYPINISQQVRVTEVSKIQNGYGQIDLFDNIEDIIKNMVVKDTFYRFSLEQNIDQDEGVAESDSTSVYSSSSADISDISTIGSHNQPSTLQ